MQQSLTYRTNRDLFSNYYLDEHLPETAEWDEISDDELREKRAEIIDLWEREKGTVAERTESGLEEKFIRLMFRKLIWQFVDVETQFLDDAVHLVKHIEESPIWKVKIPAETVDCDDYPVSVAAVSLLDC